MRIAIMGDLHTVQTFSLAGVKDRYVVADLGKIDPIEDGFDTLASNDDISIIFMTDGVAKAIGQKLKYHSELGSLYPLIITIPDISGESEGEDRVKKLIRRAVGVDIK